MGQLAAHPRAYQVGADQHRRVDQRELLEVLELRRLGRQEGAVCPAGREGQGVVAYRPAHAVFCEPLVLCVVLSSLNEAVATGIFLRLGMAFGLKF